MVPERESAPEGSISEARVHPHLHPERGSNGTARAITAQWLASATVRFRRAMARWIAPKGDLFNSDMSRTLDALIVENERLRGGA